MSIPATLAALTLLVRDGHQVEPSGEVASRSYRAGEEVLPDRTVQVCKPAQQWARVPAGAIGTGSARSARQSAAVCAPPARRAVRLTASSGPGCPFLDAAVGWPTWRRLGRLCPLARTGLWAAGQPVPRGRGVIQEPLTHGHQHERADQRAPGGAHEPLPELAEPQHDAGQGRAHEPLPAPAAPCRRRRREGEGSPRDLQQHRQDRRAPTATGCRTRIGTPWRSPGVFGFSRISAARRPADRPDARRRPFGDRR